ncbi:hypothetical protein Tco_0597689 [Tanacetum coccineum]
MADVNAPVEQAPAVAPPTRTDEQILPRIRWVPIGKSNCYLDAEKSQSNPIYKIAVDILKQTNFFRAFTASSTIPAIYIQQFWDTICYDRIAGGYKCQLDEQWFNLTKDTLRDALRITPVNNNKAFSSPPTQDTLINFVNDLGYPKEVKHLSNVVTNDMFQPWRALTTIINLCLTGKTSGFERPRAPVLQILWGIINRAHIDYAERMWEEFTQSIHTFTEDKKNLAQHTQGKKKATLIVIPSVRFTKLIIFHLQRKHKFHPRPESPLHLPTEEPILGYLKFSAKGTKREVFGMPIPNELITDDIRGADYYDAYLEKVAKHQRYLAGEEVSDPDSPAPKPAKSTKPKVTKQAKPVAPKAATKKPQPAPTKPKEKKRKQAKETTEATPPAKRAKAGKVGIPLTEPRFGDLEADMQRAIEESLKDAHGAPRGPLPPVVFKETNTGKFQPLPEVEGKGKEKFGAEQAAQSGMLLETGLCKHHSGKALEDCEADMKKFFTTEYGIKSLPNSMKINDVVEALEKSMDEYNSVSLSDLAKARKKKKKRQGLPKTPPGSPPHPPHPPPPPAGPPRTSGASSTSSTAAPSSSKIAASAEYTAWTTTDTRIKTYVSPIPEELHMDDDTIADEQAYSSSGEDIGRDHIPTVNLRQIFHPDVVHLQFQMEECHKLLTDQVDDAILRLRISTLGLKKNASMTSLRYMVYLTGGFKDNGSTLIDTHLKVIAGRDFGRSVLVESQVTCNIFSPETNKRSPTAVNLWTRNLVIRQRVEDFQLVIESYQTHLNLTKPRWDAKGFEYKHDFTVIDSPRAVTFRDKYGVQMIMRFNEIHKFSDDTLQQIDEALDYRVKEFRVNRMNPGLDTRFWMKKDVDRSKEFMFAIQKRLKTRRIFRNLESFVGGSEDGNPARANIKQALGFNKVEIADARSVIVQFTTPCST